MAGPRRPGPAAARAGELVLEPPPELPEATGGGSRQVLDVFVPMAGGAGAMVFMYAGNGGSPATYAAGGMYGISSIGMMLSQLGQGSGERRRRQDGERRDYLRYPRPGPAIGSARRLEPRPTRSSGTIRPPDCLWSFVSDRTPLGALAGRSGLRAGPPRPWPATACASLGTSGDQTRRGPGPDLFPARCGRSSRPIAPCPICQSQ